MHINNDKQIWPNQFFFSLFSSFVGPENQAINQRIFAGVRSTDTETSTTVIRGVPFLIL